MINYKEEVLGFKRHVELYNSIFMPCEDDPYDVCKQICGLKSIKYKPTSFNFSKIKEVFLDQISLLGKDTVSFYMKRIPKTQIKKGDFYNGDAQIYGNSSKQIVYVTNRDFKDTDFIATSHEFGHIPSFINPSKNGLEYYEYLETIPIYFEYLANLSLDKKNAYKNFIDIRLDAIKKEAQGYFQQKKRIKNNGSYVDQYYIYGMIESYKYIKSFEYALQLIDRAKDDQNKVNSEIDKFVYGEKTLREIKETLEIDTSQCNKILKL